MNKILKWTLITLGSGAIIFVCFWIYTLIVFSSVFDKKYSKEDLIKNYIANTKAIDDLKNYVSKAIPSNKSVDIEFDGDNSLAYFHVIVDGGYDSNWNIKLGSRKVDTLLNELGWTRKDLSTLKEKLNNANCISVKSGEPFTIGCQRSGMGMYSYKLFNHSLSDSLKRKYNDGCNYLYYKENVVLEYGGGFMGPQCFEDFKADVVDNNH